MSERADDDVKREQRKATRQSRQQQIQQGESVTAMATVGERRSLPSPEILLGQPWSNWVDAAKLNGNVGTESEESLKECGKNREAMRLCRDDMPIFGQCPAQDDFYLVMCSCCSQVVKPQAFQAHYERRHGSSSKHPSAAFPVPTLVSRRNGSAPNAKILKTAKEKLPAHLRVLHHKLLSPAVKVEKIPLKASDGHAPSASIAVSSSLRPSLNCPSIPKAPLLPPGHIPNGKTLHSSLEKKQDNGSGSRRHLHKKLSEREFNADFHCGVLDLTTRKPCTRSLTCKTHSLTQRRAVLGRRKRFDALLADHKGRAREKELQCSADPSRQTPPLRDANPAPCPSPVSHGNSTADAKPSAPSKPRPHNPSLPRPNSYPAHLGGNSHTQEDPAPLQESSLQSAPTPDGTSRLSSDEGENEEREEDCHYSGYHPRPAAVILHLREPSVWEKLLHVQPTMGSGSTHPQRHGREAHQLSDVEENPSRYAELHALDAPQNERKLAGPAPPEHQRGRVPPTRPPAAAFIPLLSVPGQPGGALVRDDPERAAGPPPLQQRPAPPGPLLDPGPFPGLQQAPEDQAQREALQTQGASARQLYRQPGRGQEEEEQLAHAPHRILLIIHLLLFLRFTSAEEELRSEPQGPGERPPPLAHGPTPPRRGPARPGARLRPQPQARPIGEGPSDGQSRGTNQAHERGDEQQRLHPLSGALRGARACGQPRGEEVQGARGPGPREAPQNGQAPHTQQRPWQAQPKHSRVTGASQQCHFTAAKGSSLTGGCVVSHNSGQMTALVLPATPNQRRPCLAVP